MEKDKYVNATELIKLAKKEMSAGFAYPEGKPTGDEDIYRQKWAFIVQVLENIKAADVTEIIRCKDCKNSLHWYRDRRICSLWADNGIAVFEDGYCNYGERKDG